MRSALELGSMRKLTRALAWGALFAGGAAGAAAGTSGYRIVQKMTVGGSGRWDYITHDPDRNRLFVAHGTKVDVVDAATGKVVGEIPDTPGVHGVVLPPGLARGFVSCGGSAVVKVFDRSTLAVTGEIPTGKNPDAIIYDPLSRQIFVSNGASASVSIIDPGREKVVATVPVGGKPEYAVPDGKGLVWVNVEDKNETVGIDARKATVQKRIALAGCEEPASLAIDAVHRRLFAGCGNRVLAVIDPDAGKVIATQPIGDHVDATLFDPETGLVFSSNGDGTITVVRQESPDAYTVVDTIKTMRGAKTMTMDRKSKRIFLPTVEGLPPTATGPPRPGGPMYPLDNLIVLVVGK